VSTESFPTTLVEAVRYFADENVCADFLAGLRWPNGVRCVFCDSDRIGHIATRSLWRCKACRKSFSVKKGTIFEDSPIPLSKWLPAMWLYSAGKKGRSSHQLARDLGVTQKTAWFIGHRIRLAMETEDFGRPLSGEVEADETLMGGKERFKHRDRKRPLPWGPLGKVAVMGLLERHGEGSSRVRAKMVPSRRKGVIQTEVRRNVEPARASTPTLCCPTAGSPPTTSMRSSTTPRRTSATASTPTGWRTSGACSSGSSTGRITRSIPSTSTATSGRRSTASTTAASPTPTCSPRPRPGSRGAGSPTRS